MNRRTERHQSTVEACNGVPISLSDIKYNSTCTTLCLPISLACCSCQKDLDILSFTRQKRKNKQCHLDPRRRCLQYWTSKWTQSTLGTEGHLILIHNRTRAWLGIEREVLIEHSNNYEEHDSISNKKKKSKPRSSRINQDKNSLAVDNRNIHADQGSNESLTTSAHVPTQLSSLLFSQASSISFKEKSSLITND